VSDSVRVYVNGKGVDVASEGTLLDAVRMLDAAAADAIEAGDRALTDSRGLPVAASSPVFAGAIVRIVSGRRSRAEGDA
jgi:hypothetical protein